MTIIIDLNFIIFVIFMKSVNIYISATNNYSIQYLQYIYGHAVWSINYIECYCFIPKILTLRKKMQKD